MKISILITAFLITGIISLPAQSIKRIYAQDDFFPVHKKTGVPIRGLDEKNYSNHFFAMTIIEFETLPVKGELMLFDVSGRVVKTISLAENTSSFQIGNDDLTDGIYFYNLFVNDRLLKKGKIVVDAK